MSVNAADPAAPAQKSWRFWITLFSVVLTFFTCAGDFTAVATILPTITVDELPVLDVWVILSYVLSATAAIPISAGFAQAIGRRWTFSIALCFFIFGSGIASAFESIEMLSGCRAAQGLGAGGMQTVAAIVLNDIIPLQERGRYSPFFTLIFVVPYLIGPIVAAALSSTWIFLINVPIGVLLLLLIIGFVKSPAPRPSSGAKALAQIDWLGNLLIVGGTASIMTGLVCGGAFFPWSSYQVIVPLVLGILGLIAFVLWEIYGAAEPILPASTFTNRTTISGYIQTFCLSVVTYAVIYFVPVYYGACIDATPIEIGRYMLGFGAIVPATAAAWTFIYLKQRYRPVVWFGWSFVVVGVALLAKAKTGESPDHVIGVSALIGVGLGFLFVSIVHVVQAPLAAAQHPQALVFLVYLRTLSGVWGIAIATAVLQNKIAPRIPSDVWETWWHHNPAWAYGYSAHVSRILPSATLQTQVQAAQQHAQVQAAYRDSLELVWATIGAIAALGLVSSLLMKAVPLQENTQGGWMMIQSGIDKEETEELIERRQKGQEA